AAARLAAHGDDLAKQLMPDDSPVLWLTKRLGLVVQGTADHVFECLAEPNAPVGAAEADVARLDQYSVAIVVVAPLVERDSRHLLDAQPFGRLPRIFCSIVNQRTHALGHARLLRPSEEGEQAGPLLVGGAIRGRGSSAALPSQRVSSVVQR